MLIFQLRFITTKTQLRINFSFFFISKRLPTKHNPFSTSDLTFSTFITNLKQRIKLDSRLRYSLYFQFFTSDLIWTSLWPFLFTNLNDRMITRTQFVHQISAPHKAYWFLISAIIPIMLSLSSWSSISLLLWAITRLEKLHVFPDDLFWWKITFFWRCFNQCFRHFLKVIFWVTFRDD